MANEKERMELQKKILEIDRQMGLEIEKKGGRVGRAPKQASFPLTLWIATIVIAGWWAAGGAIHEDLHETTKLWALLLAGLGALAAVVKTLLFLLGRLKPKKAMNYDASETDRVAELRRQRDALQKQLAELKK